MKGYLSLTIDLFPTAQDPDSRLIDEGHLFLTVGKDNTITHTFQHSLKKFHRNTAGVFIDHAHVLLPAVSAVPVP